MKSIAREYKIDTLYLPPTSCFDILLEKHYTDSTIDAVFREISLRNRVKNNVLLYDHIIRLGSSFLQD